MSFLWGHWYPIFGLLVTSDLCFKAKVDSLLACIIACSQWIPQIHLWCNTCQPLDGQHGSQLHSLHDTYVAEVGCQDSIGKHSKQACYPVDHRDRLSKSLHLFETSMVGTRWRNRFHGTSGFFSLLFKTRWDIQVINSVHSFLIFFDFKSLSLFHQILVCSFSQWINEQISKRDFFFWKTQPP